MLKLIVILIFLIGSVLSLTSGVQGFLVWQMVFWSCIALHKAL